jgi:putative transcriptional regulator
MKRKRTAAARVGVPRSAGSDFPPLTKAELAKLRPVSLAKTVRWKLGLSQADFAKRYKIPLGTLRDWEQHQSEPDQAAKSYLTAIEAEPTKIAKAHAQRPTVKQSHKQEGKRAQQ